MDFSNKTVCVTGACGTVGSKVMKALIAQGVSRLIGLDNNESAVFDMATNTKQKNVSIFSATSETKPSCHIEPKAST